MTKCCTVPCRVNIFSPNFPEVPPIMNYSKRSWKKSLSSVKIFILNPYNQFINQIQLLCDGNDHCTQCKTSLWQSNEVNHLKSLIQSIWHCMNLTSHKLDLSKIIFFTLNGTEHWKTWKTHKVSKFQFSEMSQVFRVYWVFWRSVQPDRAWVKLSLMPALIPKILG